MKKSLVAISMGQMSRVNDNSLEIENMLTDTLMIQMHQVFKTSICDTVQIGLS